MTLEIDCTTRTKQKSTLSVESLYRTRVRMLGPTLVPTVNSTVLLPGSSRLPESSSNSSSMRGALGDQGSPCPRFRIIEEFAFVP